MDEMPTVVVQPLPPGTDHVRDCAASACQHLCGALLVEACMIIALARLPVCCCCRANSE